MTTIRKIDNLPICAKDTTVLFKKQGSYKPLVKDNGTHLTIDIKMNSLSQFALNTIDKLSPVIKKHPKFGKAIIFTIEKFIKASDNIK